MSRVLKVAMKTTILSLVEQGWSFRRIHRELGVDRETVAKYARLEASKPANLPTGSSEAEVKTSQTRPPGPASIVAPFREVVDQKLQIGLDAYRIFQDLRGEHGYGGGYDAVKRFVHRLRAAEPAVYARIEVAPGQEAQVDFGTGAPTLHPVTGQYRRPHLFKMTLSFSRHSYEEVVWRQDVETFIRCHERAFRALGGTVAIVRLDNLKAGVTRACLYDPDINKVYAEYAVHAGFVPLPCQPKRPEHKGKVESGIGYTKNALKGRALGWALGVIGNRGPLALRPIQGMLGLCRKHPPEEVDWACRQALMQTPSATRR